MTTETAPAPAPPAPPGAGARRTTVPTWLVGVLVAAPTLLVLFVMSGTIAVGSAQILRFPTLLVANTPTGGDMGAHVLLPAVLKEHLSDGRILGWSQDWYAGFPMLYFYFPLPSLAIVALDVLLPYGVAFKLVAVAGLVALPGASFLLVRWLGFDRLVAAVAAVAASGFVFMESYSIFGGNIKSTLAGEFSFSWSLAISLVYLGLLVRHVREGRWSPWPGVLLAAVAMSHLVPTMVVIVAAIPLLLRRRGARIVAGSWALGFALSAFWSVPLLARVLQGMTTDMGWEPVRYLVGDTNPGSALPGELVPFAVVGLVGMVWTLLRRDDVAVLVGLTLAPLVAYLVLPLTGYTALYNARLLPYWYLGLHLFAGIAVALAVEAVVRRLPDAARWRRVGALFAGAFFLVSAMFSIHDVPGWVIWNFEGYEGKAYWPEYRALLETVDELPPGRVMWEANPELNRYGTPMALMLLPYWSEGHPSMEGLYFESSLTTPFHFLNAAEVSDKPSNPVRGLRYPRPLSFDRGIAHLGLFGVSYYLAYTEDAATAAREAGLEEVAASPPWTVFALPERPLVEVATVQPSVWAGEEDFLDASLEWYDDVENLDNWLVAEGLPGWNQVTTVEARLRAAVPITSGGTVSDLVVEDHRISFRTTAVGVPHLVKVSYFPNWRARGAEGPFRAAPSLMVIVPTQEEVLLEFVDTAAEDVGEMLTVVALLGLAIGLAVRGRRSSR